MALEAATSGAVVLNAGDEVRQFESLFTVLPFTFTFEEDSLAAGLTSHRDITVTGVAFGDFILISSAPIDQVDLVVRAFVASANTITVVVTDLSEGTNTNFATAQTFNGLILKPRGAWAIAR